MTTRNCPACERTDARVSFVGPLNTRLDVRCPSCGEFFLEESADSEITEAIQKAPKVRPVLMHAIRKMQRVDQPIVPSKLVKQVVEERDIPTAREQADNLLIWTETTQRLACPYLVRLPNCFR